MNILNGLNTNKIFWGLTMITVNIGSKYVIGDLNKFQNVILKSDFCKTIILFSMFFLGTHEIGVALFLTLVFLIVIHVFLNEKSPYNILPDSVKELMTQPADIPKHLIGIVTDDQYKEALVTIDKYKSQTQTQYRQAQL